MVAVYIYADLRRDEALWLQIDDVDLDAGTHRMLRIRAKQADGAFWQSKTKRNRTVPISGALRAYLDRWTSPPHPARWYFPSPAGRRYDPDNLSRHLRAIQARLRLPWTCLDFRHSFGSHLAIKSESLYKISTLMGNSPEVCRRHYAALLPETLAATVEFGAHTAPLCSSRSG